jgi:hypothetical protein
MFPGDNNPATPAGATAPVQPPGPQLRILEVYLRKMYLQPVRIPGFLLAVLLLPGTAFPAFSQTRPPRTTPVTDTAYVRDFTHDLTARLYFSRKYTRYGIRDYRQNQEIRYRPNDRLNFGVGLNYYFLGLNIGVNMPLVNDDDDRYGNTKYLDAQSHIYLSWLAADLYLQYYQGYYLANPQQWTENWDRSIPFPQRGDLRTVSTGLNVHYIFNHRRFSYRAAFLQNEWQKKSAGSFLLGGECYLIDVRADSSLTLPAAGIPFLDGVQFRKSVQYSLGANTGYAHTFVYKTNYFLTLSLVAGIGVGATSLVPESGEDLIKSALRLSTTARLAVGYNSRRYYAGISVVNLSLRSQMPVRRSSTNFDTGNIRVNFCRRFSLEPPGVLRRINRRMERKVKS